MLNQPIVDFSKLDLGIEQCLIHANIHSLNVKKIALSRDECHIIVFVRSCSLLPQHMLALAQSPLFCRLDLIPDGMITLRFKKEKINDQQKT